MANNSKGDADDRKAAAERTLHEGDQQDGREGQEDKGKVGNQDCLPAAAGEFVLHLDIDRPAGIADALPDILANGLPDVLGQSQIGLALRIPAAFVLLEVGIERRMAEAMATCTASSTSRKPAALKQCAQVCSRRPARRCAPLAGAADGS